MIIGFVGLGLMGRPMAGHLLKAGHQVFANDLFLIQNNKPLPEELSSAGAVEIKSLKELAAKCEVIITMVPDTPDVEKALFSKDSIAEGIAKIACAIKAETGLTAGSSLDLSAHKP